MSNIDNNIDFLNSFIEKNELDDEVSKIISKLVFTMLYTDRSVYGYHELYMLRRKILLDPNRETDCADQYVTDLIDLHHAAIKQFRLAYESNYLSSIIGAFSIWCKNEIPDDVLLIESFDRIKMKIVNSFECLSKSLEIMSDYRSILITTEITEENKVRRSKDFIDNKLASLFEKKIDRLNNKSKNNVIWTIKYIFNKYNPKTIGLDDDIYCNLLEKAEYLGSLWYQHFLCISKHVGLECIDCPLKDLITKLEEKIVLEEEECLSIMKKIMVL